ncbi:PH domain-containing protein [Natrinema gelatinilyticum]|uniref:PH domain-containing protein n=1 Tax=Natrinema gelatinilyticum TaxID=2961571 RepID=UPI0020C51691|nr:PH domain-containing protein [Natrinema gelatinilyticum]
MVGLNRRIVLVWTVYLLVISALMYGSLRVLQSSVDPVSPTVIIVVPGVSFVIGLAYLLLQYRSWDVVMQDEELRLQRGVLRTKQTFIPYKQIQHIDVEARPLERVFGLSRLVVYTAGAPRSDLVVPGLDSSDALVLQERLS